MRIKEIQSTIYQIKRESKKSMLDKKKKSSGCDDSGAFLFSFFKQLCWQQTGYFAR